MFAFRSGRGQRRFADLNEREVLGLALSLEEGEGAIYRDFPARPEGGHPASAKVFAGMAVEENEHRARFIDAFVRRYGEHIPLIRREHVRGFITRRPVWLTRPLGIETVR